MNNARIQVECRLEITEKSTGESHEFALGASYQTDTGPVLLLDLSREPDDLLSGLELAFAAFNSPDWVELIVRVPTPLADGVSVHHYSKPVRMDSKNEVIRVR